MKHFTGRSYLVSTKELFEKLIYLISDLPAHCLNLKIFVTDFRTVYTNPSIFFGVLCYICNLCVSLLMLLV